MGDDLPATCAGGAEPIPPFRTLGAQISTLIRIAIAAATVAIAATTSPHAVARSIDGHSHRSQSRLERKLADLDRDLTHAVRDARLARLTDTDRAAFALSVSTDHATIASAVDALEAHDNVAVISAVNVVLDDFRPHAYVVSLTSSGTTSAWPRRSPPSYPPAACRRTIWRLPRPCSPPSRPARSLRARTDPHRGLPSTPSPWPSPWCARQPTRRTAPPTENPPDSARVIGDP